MNPYFKNILVLTLITIVAGLGLALTFNFTKDKIADSERQEVLKSIRYVLPKTTDGKPAFANAPDEMQFSFDVKDFQTGVEKKIVFFPGLDAENRLLGFAVKTHSKIGYGGDLGLMVGIDSKGTILDCYILSMLETPGLGTKVSEEPFKGQFKNKSLEVGDTIILKKDDSEKGDIDAITGATISSRAMTTAINEVLTFYKINKKDILLKVKEAGADADIAKRDAAAELEKSGAKEAGNE